MSFEPAVLRDLAIDNGGRRIAIGAVRVPLWSAAFAQSADSFSLDNVSFTSGSATYEAKSIDVVGRLLDRGPRSRPCSPPDRRSRWRAA